MFPPSLRGFRAAFIFLTRLRVGGFPYRPEDHAWAAAYFPVVGWCVGSLSLLPLLFSAELGFALAAALAVFLSAYITGAFHEDGLADSADALYGAHGTKQVFEILKDSRVGTYGASALVCTFLLRTLCLAELCEAPCEVFGFQGNEALVVWPLVHALARVGPVWLMALLPYVSPEGSKGSQIAAGRGPEQLVSASLFGLLAAAVALGLHLPWPRLGLAGGAAVAVTWVTGSAYRRRTGGFTGDFLGATEQLTESAILIALTATRGML